ncbi:MAG: hypothetical protein EOO43_00970 [Flavobacterium sp.]|nr:MAG: hypothetical protein EOO43_00970 [Flavobacterium sp.]
MPITSKIGSTDKTNLTTNAQIPIFQSKRNKLIRTIQFSHAIMPTHEGNIDSVAGKTPFLRACINRVSNTVMADVMKYTINNVYINGLKSGNELNMMISLILLSKVSILHDYSNSVDAKLSCE